MKTMLRRNKATDVTPETDTGITRWGPATDPLAWFREMDRWFDDLRREFERSLGSDPTISGLGTVREPALDLRDNGAEFVVTAELPGVSKDGLEIQATPEGIEIKAETERGREETDQGYYFRERAYRSFYRSLPMPAPVVPDQVVASLTDGILEVRLPKEEPTPAPKVVKVKVQ